MPRRTWGPWPITRSAPASMTAWVKARELPRFSPRKVSVPAGTWVRSLPSAPRVHGHDDDLGLARGVLDHLPGLRDVGERVGPLVGREAEDRDLLAADPLDRHRPRAAGVAHADPRQGRHRLALALRAEVVGVVVRQVHHREARLLEPARVRGRGAEGEAVRAPGAALRGAAGGERALQVPEHDVAGQEPVNLVEEGRPAVGRQAVGQAAHDRVADRGDGHGLGAIGRRRGGGRGGLLAARRGLRVRGR